MELSLALNTHSQNDGAIRFELVHRGKDEHISDGDLNIILEDIGHVHIRAHDFSPQRTEEQRIADAIDRMETS